MKKLDEFLLKDFLKIYKKATIGYYIDNVQTYDRALASTRIRCYDMIDWLQQNGVNAELYKPMKKYDVVIFVKVFSEKAVKLAERLKKMGTVLMMDPFYEFLDDSARKNDPIRMNVLRLLELMDVINTCSQRQQDMFLKYHKNVKFIGDNVHEDFFEVQKQHEEKKYPVLIYCGYGKKVRDTLCIAKVLCDLQRKYNCKILFLSNEEPDIKEFEWTYLEYKQKVVREQFLLGDIMIAPRPMENIEKLSHSNTKIAYPMALGLPVVASPVPSYIGSPAILCESELQWYNELEKLIIDAKRREEYGVAGRKYILENFSRPVIGQKYLNIISKELAMK